MLKTIKITSLSDKKDILQKFESKNSLWITSDIKSKFFISDHLKKNNNPAVEKLYSKGTGFLDRSSQ